MLTIVGTVGRAAVVGGSMPSFTVQRSVAVLHPKMDICNSQYLMYALQGKKGYIEKHAKGVAQKGIYLKEIANIDLKIPSLEEQIGIAEILDKVTSVICAIKQVIQKMDELVKSRFIEMFYLQNYQRKTLAECTDFVDYRGHTPALSDNGNIRMINAKSVGKGFFKYVDEFITEETYNSWMHRGFGSPGDILFVTEGHTFGNTCLIPNDMKKFALGQRVITIKGHSEIENTFLCSYMQTDMFWKDINVYRTGGTAQGIRSKDLAKILVPIPPIDEQDEFAIFVNQVDKSKLAIQKSLDKLEILKKSLMQKYFG